MTTIHFLGTGGAITTPDRTTTMLALEGNFGVFLIDCGGDVIHRCLQAGIDPSRIEGMLITHEHPDHVGGFPLFVEKLWLHGRREPFPVFGIEEALTQAEICFGCFDTSNWKGLPDIAWQVIDRQSGPLSINEEFTLSTAPGTHGVPSIGVRLDRKSDGVSFTYSGDTEPCDSIVELARNTNILIHEANGEGRGHCSVEQAASIAKEAGAGELILVHLSRETATADLSTAERLFPRIVIAEDMMSVAR